MPYQIFTLKTNLAIGELTDHLRDRGLSVAGEESDSELNQLILKHSRSDWKNRDPQGLILKVKIFNRTTTPDPRSPLGVAIEPMDIRIHHRLDGMCGPAGRFLKQGQKVLVQGN